MVNDSILWHGYLYKQYEFPLKQHYCLNFSSKQSKTKQSSEQYYCLYLAVSNINAFI